MKDKLLLHACCGPCSTAIIEAFHNYYNITLYYYNPCITNEKAYNRRADELKRFVEETGYDVNVVIAKFNPEEFYDMAKGLEEVFEGGFRCKLCYIQRLEGTALYAKENGFDVVAISLSNDNYAQLKKYCSKVYSFCPGEALKIEKVLKDEGIKQLEK